VRVRALVLAAATAACGSGESRRTEVPASVGSGSAERAGSAAEGTARVPAVAACEALPPGDRATPLRGPIGEPDPRLPETLTRKGYSLDATGLDRALAADDPTAQLAALTAISLQRCGALLPRVEALLGAPPPTAVDAAATLAELGAPAQRTRALEVLHGALRDPSWPEVQVTAAAYLGRAGDPAAVPALQAALRATTEAIRLQAVVSIGALAGFEGRTIDGKPFSRARELDVVLADRASTWLVRREAVYQVAHLPDSAERTALLSRVARHDADERVRRAASLRIGGRP
jgi:HEAT repeat protein